uniref:Uncharacterized protein n=1 Tax=Candidatus Kentrum sp. DK TaxID=2126562 RepID=A0A450SGL0_9GAMM|nr:MAG: Protein of unknown function (DUF2559) [Candidatus Kentron sp. DK]VFJ52211.1 MAG: Protein of unknown function (DUF2559) [Candidatus Kentron sp. DK]
MSLQLDGINGKKAVLSTEDKKKIFDQSKYENFVKSARLEGIKVVPVNKTIDELVDKYKTIGANANAG